VAEWQTRRTQNCTRRFRFAQNAGTP
jgi:hypothetical protein